MKSSHLFISHAGQDCLLAGLIVSELRADESLRPWIDTERITTGTDILAALHEGLSSMDIFVVLISQASLHSSWVKQEVEYAIRKQLSGEDLRVVPFVIDGTTDKEVDALHPFLGNKRVTRVTCDPAGASMVVAAIHEDTKLPKSAPSRPDTSEFKRDPEVEELVKNVRLGAWNSALDPAYTVLEATDELGNNELFRRLVRYQECPDDDLAWGARMTMETMVELAPEFFDRALLLSMSKSPNFSVRGSAASICLELAQFAVDRVPLDVAISLARYDEDWYVTAPATAALLSICKARRNVLHFFFSGLRHPEPQARAHAAAALRRVAGKEPEILDPKRVRRALGDLRRIGDTEAEAYLAEALEIVRSNERDDGYKYGL